MNLSIEITLPVKLSREAQSRIVEIPASEYEEVVHRGKAVSWGPIAISASLKLQKASGYRARTTLFISWHQTVSRGEARAAFLSYLDHRGLPEQSIDFYAALFDNALAFDEAGILV
ncbi:MAG TPA: hypothetical protein VFI95_08375 [Terriglobales bacterium]|nr:hypothetical protein [Terriglobales bacterium]